MKRMPVLFVALWGIVTATPALAARTESPAAAFKEEVSAGLEEIFIFRTTRTARTRGATPFCVDVRFDSASEDHYTLWSMKLNTKTSRVAATHEHPVGEFRACFAALTAGKSFSMYASGTVGGLSWKGNGECLPMSAEPPVSTLRTFNCNLEISDLPDEYAGGLLTSSTAAPVLGASAAPDAHVRGYLSTSVVTLRLWKKSAAEK